MPSITDIQQQQQQQQQSASSINPGKSTPPPPSTQQTTSTDPTNGDPITQAIFVLEKKQRNLGKRKEKLESYQEEAKKGKELNKDQKEALAKYSDVLGQIECVKELNEQFKKIQSESSKNQKRLSKQATDEKRQLAAQSLRQYAQIRYLLEHRPTLLKPEESSLLDKLSDVIIPSDNSSNLISRSVDTVLSIYQNGPASIIKSLTEKNPQEIREILEELMKNVDTQQQVTSSSSSSSEQPQPQPQQQEQIKELEPTNDIQSSNRNLNEYPLQFDTRSQQIPLEQIIQDNTFFSNDLNNQTEDNTRDQSPDPKQYLPTITVVNSNIDDQSVASIQNQQQDNTTNVVTSNDEQQQQQESSEGRQQRRGSGSAQRTGQFHTEGGYRNPNRGASNHYYRQPWRGARGGRYNNSYGSGGGQQQYNEHSRGRGGPNPNYRGNRGGNYRGYNRGYNNNGNDYQKSAEYHPNNDQHQQVHSAPPPTQEQ